VAAVEVKYSETLSPREARGLIHLRDTLEDNFIQGVVLYPGAEILPLADKITAYPLQGL
jgi:hypothetical protein